MSEPWLEAGYTPLWEKGAAPGGRVFEAEQAAPLRRVSLCLLDAPLAQLQILSRQRGQGLPFLLDGGPGWLVWERADPGTLETRSQLGELACGLRTLHQAGLAHGALAALGPSIAGDGRARLWGLGLGMQGELAAEQARDLAELRQLAQPLALELPGDGDLLELLCGMAQALQVPLGVAS